MKKSLIFAGAIFLTSGIAFAKTIDFDTPIKWNSNVVERALNKSGFLGSSDANWDVRVTHERILAELLKMESFSVRDATRVCLDKCNISDFLKNGRGASGKKCPELCSGFADMLVSVNNEYAKPIDFDTPIKWDINAIKQALNDTGFKPSSSVWFVHDGILDALSALDTFSARQAVEVCMRECNKSDMLKEGRGQSGKKCPQLCEEFAGSLVLAENKANNALLTGNTERQVTGHSVHFSPQSAAYITGTTPIEHSVIITFKDEEHSSKEFCKKLTADAFERGLKYPMTCGGECKLFGNDIIEVSASGTGRYYDTLYYEVDDFCDSWYGREGKFFWRVHFDGTMEKLKTR